MVAIYNITHPDNTTEHFTQYSNFNRLGSTFPKYYSHVWWRIGVSRKLSPGNFCTFAKISGEFAKALKITFLGLKTIYILKCNIWSCNWFPPSLFTHRIILMGVPLWYYVWKTAHLDKLRGSVPLIFLQVCQFCYLHIVSFTLTITPLCE